MVQLLWCYLNREAGVDAEDLPICSAGHSSGP